MTGTLLAEAPQDCRISDPASEMANSIRPTTICHVSMSLATGGLERLLVEFSQLHDDARFRMEFIALQDLGAPAEDIVANGCDVTAMRFGEISKLRMLLNLTSHLRRTRPQIVHTHNTYAHLYGTLAAQLARVPVVINTQHGRGCGPMKKNRRHFRIANLFTDRIVAVSDDSAAQCRLDDPRAGNRILRIWNGIDVSRFKLRASAPTQAAAGSTAISVARLSPEKDFTTLLRAVNQVVIEVPDFRLQVVGDGEERYELEQLTYRLGLRNHVEFLGERSDVSALLARAGFFVSSSRTEGVSLTLLEAAAVGLPIVTTSVGGNPEVVEDERTGLLVPPEQPSLLAAAIIRMCETRDRWDTMGRQGRERVERCFEIGRMVNEYETLYESLERSAD